MERVGFELKSCRESFTFAINHLAVNHSTRYQHLPRKIPYNEFVEQKLQNFPFA